MRKLLSSISLIMVLITTSFAVPFLCGTNGYIYSDLNFCEFSCNIPCEEMQKDTNNSGACPANLKGAFYDPNTRKTYGLMGKVENKDIIYFRRTLNKTSPLYMINKISGKVRIRSVWGSNVNYDRFTKDQWNWRGFSLSRNWLLLSDGKWYAFDPPSGARRTNSESGPLNPDVTLPRTAYKVVIPARHQCYFDGVNRLEDCVYDVIITLPKGLHLVAISDARSVREPMGENLDNLFMNEYMMVVDGNEFPEDVPITLWKAQPKGNMRVYWFGEYSNNLNVYDKYLTNGYPVGRIAFLLSDGNRYVSASTPNDTGKRTGNDNVCKRKDILEMPAENFKIVQKADKCYFKGINDLDNCGKVVDITFPDPSLKLKYWNGFASVNTCWRWQVGFSLAVVDLDRAGGDTNNALANKAKVENETINEALKKILEYENVDRAWIGAEDFTNSADYNSTNPSRFKWYDYSSLKYSNWGLGEPNNALYDDDIGIVPELGEHLVYMNKDGTWGDDGYHASYGGDYLPDYPMLVEFKGALDCVAGMVKPEEDPQQTIIDQKCGGQTPCYVCGDTVEEMVQCYSNFSEVDYRGNPIGIDGYTFQIKVNANGMIDYCFDTVKGKTGCPYYDLEAFKARMLFKGDDGKYYGFAESSGDGIDTLNITPLNASLSSGNLVIDIPDGVKFVELIDVETASGTGTDNNKFDINISIEPTYICPLDKTLCTASYDDPYCPEGTLNPDRDMCQADPISISCPGDYQYDEGLDLCVLPPKCPENDSFYNPDTDRCEKPVNNECTPPYVLDDVLEVCYLPVSCDDSGTYNPSTDRCEKPPIYDCPAGYTYDSATEQCLKPPECADAALTYNPDTDRCEKPRDPCPAGYTWSDTENTCVKNVDCGVGVLNPSTDKCEIEATLSCPDSSWTIEGSTCWKPPDCGSGTYDSVLDLCTADNLGGSCPPNYTWDNALLKCVYTGDICPVGSVFNQSTNRCEKQADNGCPDASWVVVGGVCQKDPVCPTASAVYNPATNRCEKPVNSCPSGYVFDDVLGQCTQNPCKSGGNINPFTDKCEIAVTTSCPDSSWTQVGSVCQKDPECSGSGTYNATYNLCVVEESYYPCPDGYTFSDVLKKCIQSPACSPGSYDGTKDICVRDPYYSCPSGWTLVGTTCQKNPSCPSGSTYSSSLKKCVSNSAPSCPTGYTLVNGECRKEPPPCRTSDYTYSEANNRCEKLASNLCIWGAYNPSTGKCESNPAGKGLTKVSGVRCESPDRQYQSCDVPSLGFIYKIVMTNQISNTSCQGQGQSKSYLNINYSTWFYEERPICSSTVTLETQIGPNYNENDICYLDMWEVVDACINDSDSNDIKAPISGFCQTGYTKTALKRWLEYPRVSRMGIVEGTNDIWVDDGCRATFDVWGCLPGEGFDPNPILDGNYCTTCPIGTLNPSTNKCESDHLAGSCPTGDTLVNGDTCTHLPDCGSGTFVDGNPDYCRLDLSCYLGNYDPVSGKCLLDVDCGSGTFNSSTGKCEMPANVSCYNSDWTLGNDGGNYYCYKNPICYNSGVLDPVNDVCVRDPYTGSCPTGYTYSEANSFCYSSAFCSVGVLTGGKCETSITTSCPDASWIKDGSVCKKDPSCDNPGSYSTVDNICVSNTDLCGAMTLDSTNRVCYEGADCFGYTLNPDTDKCENPANYTCSTDFTLDGTICWKDVVCPDGGVLDSSLPNCVYDAVPNCPTGYIYDGGLNICKKDADCFGYSLNPSSDRCEVAITKDCPSGFTIAGTTCQADPVCDAPGNYDAGLKLCNAGNDVCGSYSLDINADVCYDPAICTGGVLDTTLDKCSAGSGTVNCGTYTYDSSTGVCINNENYCGGNTYNSDLSRCEEAVIRDCGTEYTWSDTDQLCISDILSCPDSGTFSGTLDYCFLDADHQCPFGTDYSYQWTGDPIFKCELAPNCFNGVYQSDVDKCYNGENTCPLGDNYSCVPDPSDGKNYCSQTSCSNVQDDSNYVFNDTPEGINDKQNDGIIDENGKCLGTLYIFNGKDQRCRLPSADTALNDCCKDDKLDLLGLVSIGKCRPSELVLSSQKYPDDTGVGACHEVGKYCAVKFFGICLQEKKTYCCFNSPLARIIQEAGREQLGIDWGDPKSPNCRGLTQEEFQKIDFSKVDFSDWINNYVKPELDKNMKTNVENAVDEIRNNIINNY